MIVVDTSALVAMVGGEHDANALKWQASLARRIAISTGTAVELFIVVRTRWGQTGVDRLQGILDELNVEFHDVDSGQMRWAIVGYERFGRGSGNPARLNFGDCFAYALAKALDAPLLFKGDDFVHTDLTPALIVP